MHLAARLLLVGGGAAIIALTLLSTIRSTILPRGVSDWLTRWVARSVRTGFRAAASRRDTFEGRDRVMAMFGPVQLMTLLTVWLGLILGAYTMVYLGLVTSSPLRALELSGSSLTTLGTSSTPQGAGSLLTYTEAGLGLLVITLLITYLPSIYQSFSRRENGVGLLAVRAGSPPTATEMLIRFHRINEPGSRFKELWQSWESWFTDVEETHSTFPILAYFRSPKPQQSWVTAAGTVLDTAAMWVSAVPHDNDPDAQLTLRAGFLCLRRIAEVFGIAFDPDPAPDDPVSVSRSEFDEALTELERAGITITERDAAWQAWRGWRVNYDTVLLELARLVEAPLAPWTSDRSPVGGRQRRADIRRPVGTAGSRRGGRRGLRRLSGDGR
ncbi:MAG TPA: hypothetical protein VFP61_02415 [Acidimicrobiales bacterium]|nr:hypothetical protein [Acidimicrobiales bacterium]